MSPREASTIVASRVQAVAFAFFRFRAALVPPAAVTGWTIAFVSGAPARQLLAMGGGMTFTSLFFLYEAWRTRAPMSERRLFASLVLTLALLAPAAFVTGAIGSPMLSLLFAPTLTVFAAWGRHRRESLWMFAALVLTILALFVARAASPFGPLPPSSLAPLTALFSLVTAALLWSSVAGLANAYVRAAEEVGRLREDALHRVIERSKTLDAVGAKVAHEIKNPLAAIKGLVQLLAREKRPERESKRLSVIEGEIARIERVLASYLAFARPLDELRRERVALRELADRALATVEARAARAGVALECEGDAAWVSIDRAKVEAALINVLLNAIEASPAGASVRVQCATTEDGAVLRVLDVGRGMSASTLARVGSPFFTTRADGTGLGVVIARGAIEQHGGRLEVESIEGRGTTVAIVIPSVKTQAIEDAERR